MDSPQTTESTSVESATGLSDEDKLKLVAILGCVCILIIIAIIMIYVRRKYNDKQRTKEMTELVIDKTNAMIHKYALEGAALPGLQLEPISKQRDNKSNINKSKSLEEEGRKSESEHIIPTKTVTEIGCV